MKRLLLTTFASALVAGSAMADPVNIGVILGFTGPLESITPAMAGSAELALKEASDSGKLPDGITLNPVRADSTCIDAAAATTAATNLVTGENVAAIMGADCSGVTIAIANNVAVPNGVVMVSPSATSPALSTIDDDGYFFRTSPSDARQGEVMANVVKEQGIDTVAVTYTNNDYGKGLADSFNEAFKAAGGTIAISAAHEDGKADYSAEVAALQASGAPALMVFGYVDQGGVGIVQASLDTGAFDQFFFGDGMYGQSLIDSIGDEINGKVIGTLPGTEGEAADKFAEVAKAAGMDPTAHLRPRELRRRSADRAVDRRHRLGRPHRHPRPHDGRGQRAGREDLRGRAGQGDRTRRRRHRHRLRRRNRRRADRPGRGPGRLPGLRHRGQRPPHARLPLIARDGATGRPAGRPSVRESAA